MELLRPNQSQPLQILKTRRTEKIPPVPGFEQRRRNVLQKALLLLVIGGLYAGFVHVTGWGIPCPIHLVTGLQCPGCGITRMSMALIHGDLHAAFEANAAVLCLLPLMAVTAAQLIWLHIYRRKVSSVPTDIITWFMIAVLLVFGVVRNLL